MKPERIAELQNYVGLQLADFRDGELADLLATAEREAKLREALESMMDMWVTAGGTETNPAYEAAEKVLESKGGET